MRRRRTLSGHGLTFGRQPRIGATRRATPRHDNPRPSTAHKPVFAVAPTRTDKLAEMGQDLLKHVAKRGKTPKKRSGNTLSSPLPTPVRRYLGIGNQRYVHHDEQIEHVKENALKQIIAISRSIRSTLNDAPASQTSETLWLYEINKKPELFIQACGFFPIGEINDSILADNSGQVIPEDLLTPEGWLKPQVTWPGLPQTLQSAHFKLGSSATPHRRNITSPEKSPVGHDNSITSLADASSATASGLDISAHRSPTQTPSPRRSPASAAYSPHTPAIAPPKTPRSMSPENPLVQVATRVAGVPLNPPHATTLPTSATTSSPGAMLLSAALIRQTTTPAGGSPQHRSPMPEHVTSPLDEVTRTLFHDPDRSRPAVTTTSKADLIHSSRAAYQELIRAINVERQLIESSTLLETTEPADPAEIRRLQTQQAATQRYQSTPTSHRSRTTPGPASPATPAALRAISTLATKITATQMALQAHEQLHAHDKAATAKQLLEQLFLQQASAEVDAAAPVPLPATPWSTAQARRKTLPDSPARTL